MKTKEFSRWWFERFFLFTPTWGNYPFWLVFFKGVETTNWPWIFWLGRRESKYKNKSEFKSPKIMLNIPIPWSGGSLLRVFVASLQPKTSWSQKDDDRQLKKHSSFLIAYNRRPCLSRNNWFRGQGSFATQSTSHHLVMIVFGRNRYIASKKALELALIVFRDQLISGYSSASTNTLLTTHGFLARGDGKEQCRYSEQYRWSIDWHPLPGFQSPPGYYMS